MEFIYGHEPVRKEAMYASAKKEGPVNDTSDLGVAAPSDIEKPIMYPSDLGQSVTEGSRFGNFLQTVTGAIRTGASKIELQTQMGGGGEPVGAEAYGKEAREALRELAAANEVELTSVHVPTQVGNISGFGQEGFKDEQRKMAVDEIKKAIDFAADVTRGGSITFHTGEFPRPISEQSWAKEKDEKGNVRYKFLSYKEEPGRATTYMVDDRTGRILGDVRKSNIIREPEYLRATKDYMGTDVKGKPVRIMRGDLVTEDGQYIDLADPDQLFKRVAVWDDEGKRFRTRKMAWDEIEERQSEWNRKHPENPISAEEMAYRIQVENQIMQYRGSSLYHGRFYNREKKERDAIREALDYYTKLEKEIPKEEAWRIMKEDPRVKYGYVANLVGSEMKMPSEILREALTQADQSLQYTHEASASADAQADMLKDTLKHVERIEDYAIAQSRRSMAETGIHAMQVTQDRGLRKDIYLSPENIFPEMGFGSHPAELVKLVKEGRQEMIKLLTSPQIEDPHKRIKLVKKNGEPEEQFQMVDNPYYRPGLSKKEAEQLAERHLKANLDTQHLGMWAKHFQPVFLKDQQRMETPDETNKRFNKWYADQVAMLSKEGVLGEVHVVDGYHSGGHTHLPAGQGSLPVVDAVKYLREHGFKGVMISEGHGEEGLSPGRILTKPWAAFGATLFQSGYFSGGGAFGGGGQGVRFTDIEHSYFQKKSGPYFVFGGYSPSNDWTLWTEVPLE